LITKYFRWFISPINHVKVDQKVFQMVDYSHLPYEDSSQGISDGWLLPSTVWRFFTAYFRWFISPIYRVKVDHRVV
jgi:hypothetical protein